MISDDPEKESPVLPSEDFNPNDSRLPLRPLVSLVGWIVTVSAACVGALLILHDVLSGQASPYTGVLTYMLIPVFLGSGLLMIFGAWISKIRSRRRGEASRNPALILDLNNPRHINRMKQIGLLGTFIAVLSAIGGYRSFHFTESTEFCGVICHKVMEPEFVAYEKSPHARVACVECHIGGGADWYVKSKMSGLRQVYAYLTESYDLPIETPIKHLRPARETCEECHWPEKFSGDMEKTITRYTTEEDNHPYAVRLVLKVGGGSGEKATGIHWHVSSGYRIEYVSTDKKRLTIPWVKMTAPDGKETVFTSEEFDPEILDGTYERRTMDCIDCHNRPSHIFNDPRDLVDEALDDGRIDAGIPEIKANVMELFEEFYPSTPAAYEAIEETLTEIYLEDDEIESSTLEAAVNQAIASVKEIYHSCFFPEQSVDWTTHPNFRGHFRWDGCYRCHDGQHESESGEVISHECNHCHLIAGQAEGFEEVADLGYELTDFLHPLDMGELDPEDKCTDCHGAPDPTDYDEVREGESQMAKSD